jgi:hypothetical protein
VVFELEGGLSRYQGVWDINTVFGLGTKAWAWRFWVTL